MVRDDEAQGLTMVLLGAANALVDGIHTGVVARGFDDLRPAHGFAFTRLAPDGATISDLAAHLDVTRQAASQLVDELDAKGYVTRRPHPDDGRARLVVLTERGWACTRAAEEAAAEVVGHWAGLLGEDRLRGLTADLSRLARPGRLRPTW